MAPPATTFEFVVGAAETANVLTAGIISVVSDTGVEILADENVHGLVAGITPLELTLSAPREDPMPFC